MRILSDERLRVADAPAAVEPAREGEVPLLTILWFGLLTGWLELGLVLSRRAVNPRISMEMLRTNRHFVWMVLVSDVLIFVVAGLSFAPLAWFCPRLARWLAWRLPISLAFSALLLAVEGLHGASGMLLACGLASVLGPWLGRRAEAFGRLVRVSLPAMALGLVVLTGLTYGRVTSGERRALARCPTPKPGAPNVLLIVLDDVRAASLSLFGHDRPTSPHLDWWARRGIAFSEARSPAPWTLPSHASMFTGRWPHELSVGPDRPLDRTFPTLAETLAREGYATAGFVGNTIYCNSLFGLDRGFARYEDDYENQTVSLFETIWSSGLGRRLLQVLGYPTRVSEGETSVRKTAEMLNRDVLKWLGGLRAGQPFFAFVNYYDAHTPFLPPDGPDPRFGLGALPLAERYALHNRYMDLKAGKLALNASDADRLETEAMNLYRDSYESCIVYLDRQLGLLLDAIERRGVLENTLVIVTSDHGEHFSEHHLVGHGLSLYRREVHVPLVLIPPARSSTSKVVYEPVSLREIPATVAEWADLGPRNPFPGRSLMRFLDDDATRLPETSPVLCEVQHLKHLPQTALMPASLDSLTSLVSGRQVYIRGVGGREELYDLFNDFPELDDLTKTPGSHLVLNRFRAELSRLCHGDTASDEAIQPVAFQGKDECRPIRPNFP